jgi:hypothetical protein
MREGAAVPSTPTAVDGVQVAPWERLCRAGTSARSDRVTAGRACVGCHGWLRQSAVSAIAVGAHGRVVHPVSARKILSLGEPGGMTGSGWAAVRHVLHSPQGQGEDVQRSLRRLAGVK